MRLVKARETSLVRMVLAAVAVVLAIKLGKLGFSFLDIYGLRTVYSSHLFRLLALLGVTWALNRLALFKGKRLIKSKAILVALPMLGVALAKVAQAVWTRHLDIAYLWITTPAFEVAVTAHLLFSVLRPDLLFFASFALLVWLVAWVTPTRFQRILSRVCFVLIALMLVISGLELALYCKTGLPGTGQLLGFFVSNAATMAPMLKSQLDATTLPALVMPLLVWLGLSRVTLTPPGTELSRELPRRQMAIPATLLLTSALVHPVPYDHQFDRLLGNTFLALRDLAPWRTTGELEAKRRAQALPLLFDTSKAVLRTKHAAPRKNVIVIMLESTRAFATSPYDPKIDSTPFLTDFAKRGAVVSSMYAGVPRTSAAWMSVINGVFAPSDEVMARWIKSGQQHLSSMPMLLAPAGYSSAFFTTAHLDFMYDAALVRSMRFGTVHDAKTLPRGTFEHVSYTGFEDRMMLEPSLAWVAEQVQQQKPFYLALMTNVGHFPYTPPSTWPVRSFATTDSDYARYLNCLAYVDSVLKDFVAGLEKLGVLQSSIVLILGDHGESMGEHGPRVHTLVIYDEALRIPAILYADGLIPPRSSIAGIRQEIDVIPTILELLGKEAMHATLPGTSLLQPIPDDRPAFFAGAEGSQFLAVRRGDLKFIYNYERTPTEVYSMTRDPDERHDIAASLPQQTIENAEMDMLVWRERVSRAFTEP